MYAILIASFATLIGALAGIMGVGCGVTFSITPGFMKKYLKTTRSKKKIQQNYYTGQN